MDKSAVLSMKFAKKSIETMKRNKVHSKVISRISRRDNLPLLRGMFISPEPAVPVHTFTHSATYDDGNREDGLFLTAKQAMFLEG
jgi:hypothetical protein